MLDSLDGMASAPDHRALAESAISAFREAVKGDYYSVCCFAPDFQNVEIFHPGEGWLGAEAPVFRSFRELQSIEPISPSHPATIAFEKDRKPGGFIRSLLMSDRHWRNTAHYQVVDRRLGIRDMASIFLYTEHGRLMTLNCGRSRTFHPGEIEPVTRMERVMTLLLRGRSADILREESNRRDHPSARLTSREMEVLRWVREGKRNGEIAVILTLSPHTIRKHLENIFRKLGVETRAGAVNSLNI